MEAKFESKKSESRFQVILDKCNNFYKPESSRSRCASLYIGDEQVGLVRQEFLPELFKHPDVFLHEKAEGFKKEILRFAPDLNNCDLRSEKIQVVLEELREKDKFCSLRGWRNEKYDIARRFHDEALLVVERAATPIFGMINYGVHVNGYFFNDSGEMMMWLGQRSAKKATYPNMLDNMCAGGLATGLGIKENVIKECQEEASVDDDTLMNLISVGTVSYCYEDERGILPECQFIFDLELTPEFEPVNADGEVGGFHVHPITKVKELILSDKFKPNCALIILDFLIRHGIVTPENEPFYVNLVEELHKPLHLLMD